MNAHAPGPEPVVESDSRGRTTVYLHVGGPKTGTTYLQEVLWRNRTALLNGGVLYPGSRPDAHFRAAQDLLGQPFNNYPDPGVPGTWQELLDEATDHGGTVVVSHELLGLATQEDVDRALHSLAFADVHILYTARDLARQIPSVWQEDLKNGHALSFDDFIKGLRGDEAFSHRLVELFWRYQSPVRVLATWSRNMAPDRVHVVTVPPPGGAAGLLWERFAEAIGIEPDEYAADGSVANRSLGVVEAGFLRRINLRLASSLDWPTYEVLVKSSIAGALVETSNRMPIALPESEHGWVVERSKQFVSDLREAGYDVVGDLDDLSPGSSAPDGFRRHPDDASEAEQLDVAADAMVGLARSLRAAQARRASGPATPQEADALALIKRGLQGLSEQNRLLMLLRRLYRVVKRSRSRLGGRRSVR